MDRAYYSGSISTFLGAADHEILWALSNALPYSLEQTQKDAWIEQVNILKSSLARYTGRIYFEYGIPRMGKRIDVVLIIDAVIFVLEFKVGETRFTSSGVDRVCNYCLDLKNFHDASHNAFIAPILIATRARRVDRLDIRRVPQNERLFEPIKSTVASLTRAIESVLDNTRDQAAVDCDAWSKVAIVPHQQ